MPGLPRYGIAFAFFLACAGHLGPPSGVTDNTGLAGSFPVGCYDDATGQAVGADRFVPGYTTVYAFADGYTNKNPPVCDLSVTVTGDTDGGAPGGGGDGGPCMPDLLDGGTGAQVYTIPYCDVSTAARVATGCNKTDAFSACATYDVSVDVPATVADYDSANGVYETVWVDYFADQGDINDPVLLVADAVPAAMGPGPDGIYPPSPGIQVGKFVTQWVPPPPPDPDAGTGPETATIWAVVHDSRGGSTVVSRTISLYAGDGGVPEGGP
jgi:hypothetical protein